MYNSHADVTALLDSTGAIVATYYYDAFGNIVEQTGNVNNNITYAGYQYDKETGLYYLNARMYDPVTARFLQEDTYRGQANDPLSLQAEKKKIEKEADKVRMIADSQTKLNKLGYKGKNGKSLDVDGAKGTQTSYATRNYQSTIKGLAVDGDPGTNTLAALNASLANINNTKKSTSSMQAPAAPQQGVTLRDRGIAVLEYSKGFNEGLAESVTDLPNVPGRYCDTVSKAADIIWNDPGQAWDNAQTNIGNMGNAIWNFPRTYINMTPEERGEFTGGATFDLGLMYAGAKVAGKSGATAGATEGTLSTTNVSADIRKFTEYIFKDGAAPGKDVVYKNMGYSINDSEVLINIYKEQATFKYAKGEYTLGKVDSFGQRINIEVELPGIGNAAGKTSYLKSGWMIKPDGSLSLNTPFSGFTK